MQISELHSEPAARLMREQKRQVTKVLLDGLYDPDSLLNMLLGVRTEVVGEIVWKKMLAWNWKIFHDQKIAGNMKEVFD